MAVELFDVAFFVCFVLQVPRRAWPLNIEKEGVVDTSEFTGVVVRGCPLPNHLILKVILSKHRIHHHLQIMARCRIAVEVDAAGVFQDTFHLQQAGGHHDEVALHPFPMRFSRGLDYGVQGWGTLGKLAMFGKVNVGECPSIFEGGTGGSAEPMGAA